MATEALTFRVDTELLAEFRRLAKERGHTMTWYLTGCIKEIVNRSHQEQEEKGGEARQARPARKRK